MTVSTAYAPLPFNGNGVTTAFSVTWPFYTGTLKVTLISSTGVETVKTISTHYTVSGGTDGDGLPAVGTVTMLSAPASGETLRIERVTPKTQSSVWTNGGAFDAKTLESALDRNLLITQEAEYLASIAMHKDTSGATDFWDADDAMIRNVADGTEDDAAVTKAQLDAAVFGDSYFTQAGTGAVERTWQSKARDAVSVLDFGTDAAAINAALSAHQSVYLPPGDYDIGSTSIALNDGNRLFGPGRLVRASGDGTKPLILIDNADDVMVDGVGGVLSAGADYFIYTRDSDRVHIRNCRGGSPSELWLGLGQIFIGKNTTNWSVVGCALHGGQLGIGTGGDPLGGDGAADGTVLSGLIAGNEISSTRTEAIDINWDTTDLRIIGNWGRNIGTQGDAANEMIDIGGSVDGTGSKCREIEVASNYFEAADTSGNAPGNQNGVGGVVLKLWSQNVKVHHNVFIGAQQASTRGVRGQHGIVDCAVEDNFFYGFSDVCAYTADTGIPLVRAHFRRNVGRAISGTGITTQDGSNTYTDCDFSGNDLDGTGASSDGISLRDVIGGDVSRNNVRNFGGNGINLGNDCTGLRADYVRCTGNAVDGLNCAAPGTIITSPYCALNGLYGIDLLAADIVFTAPVSVDNVALGGSEYNIRVQGSCSNLVWTGGFVDDTRTPKLARGVNFSGAITGAVVRGFKVDGFLTTAVGGISNIGGIFDGCEFGQTLGPTTVNTDADFTLTPHSSAPVQVHAGTLTTTRTITLSTSNARANDRFRITRTGAGSFNLSVGGLVNLTTNTWCEVVYNGSAWVLAAFGFSLGADIGVADGGTGASTARGACANLGTWNVLAQNAVSAAKTGTGATLLGSVLVPGGALGPNGSLRITSRWTATASVNNKTLTVSLNTSASVGGTNLFAHNLTTNTAFDQFTLVQNRNSASSQISAPTNYSGSGPVAASRIAPTLNTANDMYVIFSCANADAGDTTTLEGYVVELCYGA